LRQARRLPPCSQQIAEPSVSFSVDGLRQFGAQVGLPIKGPLANSPKMGEANSPKMGENVTDARQRGTGVTRARRSTCDRRQGDL
jgi:hypothetical protein